MDMRERERGRERGADFQTKFMRDDNMYPPPLYRVAQLTGRRIHSRASSLSPARPRYVRVI